MKNPRISIIAAIGKNRELGKKNELIWRIPDDLKRVKALTTGHPIIMGRATYESIGRPLPNRTNIVISRTITEIPGCLVFSSLPDALAHAKQIDTLEIFIFGGASLYTEALSVTSRLYLTLIDDIDPDADVFFPEYGEFKNILEKEHHPEHTPSYTWVTLER